MKKESETQSVQSAQVNSRRRLFKAIAAGGAVAAVVPAEWAAPAIKSVVLPAHATTTGTGTCGIHAWYFVSTGTTKSYSMSANVRGDAACDGYTTVKVYDPAGALVGSCQAGMVGAPNACFSCSQSGHGAPVASGTRVTFVADTGGGCSCTFITTSQ